MKRKMKGMKRTEMRTKKMKIRMRKKILKTRAAKRYPTQGKRKTMKVMVMMTPKRKRRMGKMMSILKE